MGRSNSSKVKGVPPVVSSSSGVDSSHASGARKAGQRVGYIRVSTLEQNTARQLDGVTLDRSYTDHASGKDTQRPALAQALDWVRDGDTLIVHSMDRLARSLDDLRRLVRELTGRGVKVEFIKENLVFTGEDSSMSNLLLNMLGAVAEFERSMIRERQREGIAKAKARGVYRGGKPKLSPEQVAALKAKVATGGAAVNKAALARELRISRETLYSYLDQ
jgi:DNA invertase Pin-like site-specific DNA recombinase